MGCCACAVARPRWSRSRARGVASAPPAAAADRATPTMLRHRVRGVKATHTPAPPALQSRPGTTGPAPTPGGGLDMGRRAVIGLLAVSLSACATATAGPPPAGGSAGAPPAAPASLGSQIVAVVGSPFYLIYKTVVCAAT